MKEFKLLTGVLIAAFCLAVLHIEAQTAKGRRGTFALTNATIETITKGTIANGTLIISNGKITGIGNNVTIPSGAEVIDCKGMSIYPGMIDSGTNLGLVEIAAEPRTNDNSELGEIIPQMRASTAINPSAVSIPVTRVNGVTTVISAPNGGLFPGTASLINLHGYTPDQMLAGYEAVILNFPNSSKRGFFDRRTEEEIKKANEAAMKTLNDVWDKAVQYYKIDSASHGKGMKYYPEMEALLPVIKGERALMVEANNYKDILAALKWIKERKVKMPILTGAAEGWRVTSEIAKSKLPVIVGSVIDEPSRDYDRYDRPYSNPGLLHKAGIKIAIKSESGNNNYRNLPYFAGFAAAYGLGREEALKAITINPAEFFGVADKLGSLETGKNATLFICDGDPFETKTQVKYVFIDGWQMPMTNRQIELYNEFLKREPGLSKEK